MPIPDMHAPAPAGQCAEVAPVAAPAARETRCLIISPPSK